VAASSATREQLGVSRWDVHDAPTITGCDTEDQAVVFLQHERIEQGSTVVHRFGLREHANEATTQVALPKDGPPGTPLQLLASHLSDGFDPKGVLALMLNDFQPNKTSSALSTSTFGARSIRPLGGSASPPPPPVDCSKGQLTTGCPELTRPFKEQAFQKVADANDQAIMSSQCISVPLGQCRPQ
jgi:hypothetical protein